MCNYPFQCCWEGVYLINVHVVHCCYTFIAKCIITNVQLSNVVEKVFILWMYMLFIVFIQEHILHIMHCIIRVCNISSDRSTYSDSVLLLVCGRQFFSDDDDDDDDDDCCHCCHCFHCLNCFHCFPCFRCFHYFPCFHCFHCVHSSSLTSSSSSSSQY